MTPAQAVTPGAPPADRTLRASGPPGALRIPFWRDDDAPAAIAVRSAALIDVRTAAGHPLDARSVSVGFGGGGAGHVRLRLRQGTPPGVYRGEIDIAGVARPIEIDVAPQVSVAIEPLPLVVDLAPGPSSRHVVAFENKGNVPLVVDVAGDYPFGEEVPISPANVVASADGSVEQLAELVAELLEARRRRVLKGAGTLAVTMPDGPIRLEPGAIRTAALHLTFPADLPAVIRYRCYVPIYNADLEIVAVTATKPGHAAKPRPRNKGANP